MEHEATRGISIPAPLDLMIYPGKLTSTHLYTWVNGERHFESEVSCPRTGIRPVIEPGLSKLLVERTNHEVTEPPI